ncbi:MAG: ABC transporter permease [Gemmatimonadales bacterium]|nr:ABC transporter permease [Gemmatimonadales bacterium]
MNAWTRFLRTLRSLVGRGPIDRDLEFEVGSYLDLLADEKMAAGAGREEALRQAQIELGGSEQVKEAVRSIRPAAWLDNLARDVRYGLRVLAKSPGFSLAAVVIVALAVGANSAVFGLVNVLLLQPPPGAGQRDRSVGIYSHDPATPDSYRRFSYAEYETIRDHAGVFEQVMAYSAARVVMSGADESRRAEVELVTSNYFSTLGVTLAAGRGFTLEEEAPGSAAAVAVISHATWRALGGQPGVVGGTILLNSRAFTVIGVAPEGFAGTMVAVGPNLWVPIGGGGLVADNPTATAPHEAEVRAHRTLLLVGRLRGGVSATAANAGLVGLSERLQRDDPEGNTRRVLSVHALARTENGTDPGDDSGLLAPLGILSGLAVVLLVVASLNLANMQLARNATRRKEIAMRLALGAARARVVQQLLTEGLLVALTGGVLGLLIGVWTLRLLVASFTPMIDQATSVVVSFDWRLVAATLAYAVLSAVVFAVAPSWKLVRVNLLADLKGNSRNGEAGYAGRIGPRHLLVAGQVALSLALLAAAGLFVRAALAAAAADPGYRLDGQLLARVDASGLPEAQGRASYRRVIERVSTLPGVASVSMASLVGFGNESTGRLVQNVGAPQEAGGRGSAVLAQNYVIGAAYFRTLGVPLLRGREFTETEEREPGPSRVAVIDEPLAAALFGGQDPIGQHLCFASAQGNAGESLRIIGLAPGLRHRLTDRGPVAHVYTPFGPRYMARVNIHARQATGGRGATAVMLRELRGAIEAADARIAVLNVSTLDEVRDSSPISWLVRAAGIAFGTLGVMALAMAATGLYGVKAYLVTRRRREIGIRLALGATPEGVVGLMVKEGALLLGGGIAIGFVLALGAGRIVSRLLVGVQPLDPLVLILATSALTLAVLAASYIPARRATRVDPAVTLRDE